MSAPDENEPSPWKAAIAVSAIVLAVMQVPYVAGMLLAPRGARFLGLTRPFLDQSQYFAWIQEASDGKVLLGNRADPEARARVFFHPLFVPMGWLSRAIPPMAVYHGARVLLEAVGLLLLWRLVAIGTASHRLWAFTLAAAGGGMAPFLWLVRVLGGPAIGSADLDVPENSFFSATQSLPHFGAALSLEMALAIALLRGRRLPAALFLLLLGLCHVFDMLTMTLALAVFIALERRWRYATVAMAAAPAAAYYSYLTYLAPGYRELGRQNVTLSPGPMRYVLGLTVPLVLAALAVVLAPPRTPAARLLLCWALASGLLLYAPMQVQRRFHLGFSIPLCLLASQALDRLPWRRGMAGMALALALPSSIYWVGTDVATLARGRAPYYLVAEEEDALRWLSSHADRDSVLLASPTTSQQAMVLLGQRTYYLHPVTTSRSALRRRSVLQFYRSGGSIGVPEELASLVYWGRSERALSNGSPTPPESLLGRAPAYQRGGVSIWDLRER